LSGRIWSSKKRAENSERFLTNYLNGSCPGGLEPMLELPYKISSRRECLKGLIFVKHFFFACRKLKSLDFALRIASYNNLAWNPLTLTAEGSFLG
jgi:hypothetical protein